MLADTLKRWLAASSKYVASSARLAKKQAELATLNNVTLPRLYHAIGKRIIGSENLPVDLGKHREQIHVLQAAIATKAKERNQESASGFAAKAKKLAQRAAASTAKASADTAAQVRIQAAYVGLGKQAVEGHGQEAVPTDLWEQYEGILQKKKALASETVSITGGKRKAMFSQGRLKLLGVGTCLLLALIGIRSFISWANQPSELRKMAGLEGLDEVAKPNRNSSAGSQTRKKNSRPAGFEPLVSAVLGTTSQHYLEFGYKGVVLGQSFDEINSCRPLGTLEYDPVGGPNVDGPCVYRDVSGTPEAFWFDANKRLVCYRYSYRGGANEYLPEIEGLFGEPSKPIDIRSGGNSLVTHRTTSRCYAFPRTFVLVEFHRTADIASAREFTHVYVFDRAYLERLLREVAAARVNACLWIMQAGMCLEKGDAGPERCPPLMGCRVQVLKKLGSTGAALFDTKYAEGSEAPFLGFVAFSEIPDRFHEPMIFFDFNRYPASRVGLQLLRRPETQDENKTFNADVFLPYLRALKGELTALLLSSYFPMPNDECRLVSKRGSDLRTYKWEFTDAAGDKWAISCGEDDLIEVFYRARKKL